MIKVESSGAQEDMADGRSRTVVTRVKRWETRIEYATRERVSGLGLKTIGGGFTGLGLKTRAEVSRRNERHMAASKSSRRGKATDEEARWPSDEDDTGLDHNALGLSGLTKLYLGTKLELCNSPVK
jgi:hypothetical protein